MSYWLKKYHKSWFNALIVFGFVPSTSMANPLFVNLSPQTETMGYQNDANHLTSNQASSQDSTNGHVHTINSPKTNFGHWINQSARTYGVDAYLIIAIIYTESNFSVNAVSPKGAVGLMQVLPSTATQYGQYNLFNPEHNIHVGTRHFARLLARYRSLELALAAYNAGEGNIAKYGGIPPFAETRQYVAKVLRHYQAIRPTNSTSSFQDKEPKTSQANGGNQRNKTHPIKPPTPIIIHLTH